MAVCLKAIRPSLLCEVRCKLDLDRVKAGLVGLEWVESSRVEFTSRPAPANTCTDCSRAAAAVW
jgi:hypothetical protein